MSEDSDEMIIETEGVRVNFGDFWALKGVDIKVRKGEIIVILGPSGSGKSTFIRTLNRLQPHSGGTIKIDGITVDEDTSVSDLKYVRSEIGFVFQQFNLFPHLTIMENITLAPMKVKRMPKREAEQRAMELLERVGIPEQAYKYPSGLSGGQQQQLAIARALIIKPRLLLLDEPTEGIQPNIISHIGEVIQHLKAQNSMAILLVEQFFEFAFKMADYFYVMKRGQIVFEEAKSTINKAKIRSALEI